MKDRIFVLALFAASAGGFYFAARETQSRAVSDRLEGVGGVEAYRRERLASLFRLLKHADRIEDDEVRDREIACIQAQIDRLERGEKEGADELGDELRVERFGN